jgi:hypothetical protein
MATKVNLAAATRLTDARKIAGYISASDAIKYCLWDSPAYYQHEAGELEISPEDAQKYAAAYKVSAHWILTGAHQ